MPYAIRSSHSASSRRAMSRTRVSASRRSGGASAMYSSTFAALDWTMGDLFGGRYSQAGASGRLIAWGGGSRLPVGGSANDPAAVDGRCHHRVARVEHLAAAVDGDREGGGRVGDDAASAVDGGRYVAGTDGAQIDMAAAV